MNKEDLARYLALRIKQLGISTLNPQENLSIAEMAIDLGLHDFWHARVWSFRQSQYNLSISSEQDRYALPDECVGVAGAREETSTAGSDLYYVSKAEFDRLVPRPSAHSGGTPQLFTVYKNADDGVWYIQFHPRPTVSTVMLTLAVDTPTEIVGIPSSAFPALIACCFKYLYHPETNAGMLASTVADREIRKLEVQDSPWKGSIWRFFDSTDEPIKVVRPWE